MDGRKILTIPNMSAGFSVIWGLWAIAPWWNMFALNPKLYGPMLALVPYGSFWGGLFFTAGLAAWMLSYYGRQYTGAFILFIVYAFFASLYFMGDYRSPGWALYGYVGFVHFLYWGGHRWRISN